MDDFGLPLRENNLTVAMTAGTQYFSSSTNELLEALQEARQRTLELIDDLSDEQLMGPPLRIVNPLRWETGHVAWFQEFWVLRHLGGLRAILNYGDDLYDSARVAHDTRWNLPLLSRSETLKYMSQVLERVCDSSDRRSRKPIHLFDETYFLHLVLFHEQMHAEAITYTRQTLSYPRPRLNVTRVNAESVRGNEDASGDVFVPGGRFVLGDNRGATFVFDNEQQPHTVEVLPFVISKTAICNAEFASFVDDQGYNRRELWSGEGWQWRQEAGAEHPVYWQRESNGEWLRRDFDKWVPLENKVAVIHVNWHEAEAYCRWARRRLPTEAEWEMAASCEPSADGRSIADRRRMYPWGNEPPTQQRANLDWQAMGCIEVDALPASDSALGCRQMIGNAWEWTNTTFGAYPGFELGPYKEYSAPWFGDHKVLRGGCWATRSRMIRNGYRNFYTPDRRDVFAGFRTCAL